MPRPVQTRARPMALPRTPRLRTAVALLAGVIAAAPALAQGADSRMFRHDGADITLHLHGFLSAEDRGLLEVLAASPDSLDLLLGERGGHAALALAPSEGMVRDGVPSASASAVGALPDADSARREALAMCEAARGSGPACVVVLEVAPR